ncbi:putative permease of the major facilitator superfamily [Klebsiella pneumoniae]|uniref:Putative permease of the major facilitator superfamily n=1 Tax=Klebsiella pneumoniae TaxID=573 RepID=A0A3S4IIN7_KLEPN|nr:putative permease of the major facilitator superfamily [Klebsiella pneumoniae]
MATFGILFALVGFLASQGLKLPPPAVSQPVSQTVAQSSRSFTSREMLRQPLFWLMFAMMAMMSTSGLMVTSQMAVFAEDFGISQAVVFGMAALPLALTIDRFTNGLTRPLFGFISDRFGREQTMFIAFALEGVAMMLWLACREDPLLFVLLSGVVFFGWGGDLLALPVDAHRYVRQRTCRQQLWLAVYFAGHRVNLWRSAGGTALSVHSRLACGLQLRDWP